MTEDLIDRLAADLRPARGDLVTRRLAGAVGVGALATLAFVVFGLGLRDDYPAALASRMFWMKLAYPLALAAVALWGLGRLSRPTGDGGGRLAWIAAPLALMAAVALVQLGAASAADRRALVMGHSAMVCPWRILAAAAPIFLALVWALRGLAPTRPHLTGAAAGLAAGGLGAMLYALACPEPGAAFVTLWYSAGVLASAALGAILGPRLLRW